jgi:hypothetical protein
VAVSIMKPSYGCFRNETLNGRFETVRLLYRFITVIQRLPYGVMFIPQRTQVPVRVSGVTVMQHQSPWFKGNHQDTQDLRK